MKLEEVRICWTPKHSPRESAGYISIEMAPSEFSKRFKKSNGVYERVAGGDFMPTRDHCAVVAYLGTTIQEILSDGIGNGDIDEALFWRVNEYDDVGMWYQNGGYEAFGNLSFKDRFALYLEQELRFEKAAA